MRDVPVTGVERFFDADDIIVSKTDLKGRITYANQVFLNIADFKESEVLGEPHSIIRHPDMPRCIFKTLWDTVQAGQEIYAYVINRTKGGDHYWVYAHVTPSFDAQGRIISYHSNRRVPDRAILENRIIPLYRELKAIEDAPASRKDGLAASERAISELLAENGMAYDEFVATLAA